MRKKLILPNKGQSLVEMALILPILIMILTGIIDFGILFNNNLIISNAAREGARYAALGYLDADVSSNILNIISMLDKTKVTITVSPVFALRQRGQDVSVTVEYNNSLITPIISTILPNPIHLKAKTVMRIE